MRYYETLFMINPNLSDEVYGEIKTKFTSLIEKNKGVIVHVDDWGKKSLAYLVKNFDKGYYVLVYYCGKGDLVAGFERGLRLDERIFKYQTVKLRDQVDPEALKLEMAEANKEEPVADQNVDGEESDDSEKVGED
jgi:small subunit ribosomal protein S6